ncbi:MAG: DNA/RNA non-specific endonuclease [Prevotella sp.]|nr:DNA/RNA non-specific endonuclease [Prevotella sp.]
MLSCNFLNRPHKPLIGGIRPSEEAFQEIIDNSAKNDVVLSTNQAETSNVLDESGNAVSPKETEEGINIFNHDTDVDELEIPAPISGRSEQILKRTGYTTSYNKQTKLPNWTAWHLTADHTSGAFKRKGVKYHEDNDVPFPKAQNADYYNSGYDRGHMCPSGDNKWSRQAQEDCFLFTNMCPQSHNLNGGDWNDLEMKCRAWAETFGDIYIVCGPIIRSKGKTIGRNKVVVPDAFFKVVLSMHGVPKAIGFLYDNEDGHAPMVSYMHSVDEIERITGIDFFPRLSDDVESRVEAQANWDEWN